MLRLLQEEISEDPTRNAEDQVREAIELLRNLPVYGELLLGERGR